MKLPRSLFQLTLTLTLTAGLAVVFLTTSCERRGGVPLTTKAEGTRLTGVRRIFLADSNRWREPRAAEIAALTEQDRGLKLKWRGLTIPATGGGEAITVARELTAVRQKLDRACEDRALLTKEAKKLWDEYEASDWAGFSGREIDTGYKDPYAYYAAMPKKEERDFLAKRAKVENPLWTVLDAAKRKRDEVARAAKSAPNGQSKAAADAEMRRLEETVRVAAGQYDAAERETARLQKDWEARSWAGYVMD